MPSLRELQTRFADAVLSTGAPPASFAAGDRADARVAVYRRNVLGNYRNALAATYPVVRRLVGPATFTAAVDGYVAAHPSTCGDLNVYGDRFGDFLAGHGAAAIAPYVPDVARLEWAIDEAHRAADAPRDPEAVLAAFAVVQPERLPALELRLDPSCRLVVSPWPILPIWKANPAEGTGDVVIPPDDGGGAVLVRRDAQGVALERIADGEHAWLTALAAGAGLGVAIDAAQREQTTFDLGEALRTRIADGTIVAVVDG